MTMPHKTPASLVDHLDMVIQAAENAARVRAAAPASVETIKRLDNERAAWRQTFLDRVALR